MNMEVELSQDDGLKAEDFESEVELSQVELSEEIAAAIDDDESGLPEDFRGRFIEYAIRRLGFSGAAAAELLSIAEEFGIEE